MHMHMDQNLSSSRDLARGGDTAANRVEIVPLGVHIDTKR
jgi:hypothetical protein